MWLLRSASPGQCLAWRALLRPGGKADLTDPNWVPVSPTLTAGHHDDSYCIALPNPNQFFRVAQGCARFHLRPVGAGLTSSLQLTRTSSNASLNWSGSSTQKFRIQ